MALESKKKKPYKKSARAPLARLVDQKAPPRTARALLFRRVALATLPEPIFPGALVVENGLIADLGEDSGVARRWRGRAQEIDASGYIILPGLINSHTHAAMGFLRDRTHGRPGMIEEFFFPMEKHLTRELIAPLSYSFLLSGLLAGTTAVVDHYYFSESVAKAINIFSLRGAVGETVADLGGAFPSRNAWAKARNAIANWRHGPRVVPVVAPHAADTVSEAMLGEMASYARANNLPLHMHLAQTQGEAKRVRAASGMSPAEKAARAGALGEKSLLVHMLAVNGKDLDLVRREGGTICLSPASQILYEKLAPIADFVKKRIPLALGTDCACSNDGADLFSEMRLTALLLHDRLSTHGNQFAREVFRMCTEVPGKIFFGGKAGALAPQNFADLVFLRHSLGNAPVADLFSNIVFSCGSQQVENVMVDGKWVLWKRKHAELSLETLNRSYTAATKKILARTSLPKELSPLAIPLV